MSKILILGGSFDPPHKGHISTATRALTGASGLGFNELWFMPCVSDAFGEKNLSPVSHRLEMLKLILLHSGLFEQQFKISTFESDLGESSGTYHVMRKMMEAYPQHEFAYVIGTDQAERIRQWRNSRKLLKLVRFVVVKRNRSVTLAVNKLAWLLKSDRHLFIWADDGLIRPTSSTEIRRLVELQTPWFMINHYTEPAVTEYIKENKLYKE